MIKHKTVEQAKEDVRYYRDRLRKAQGAEAYEQAEEDVLHAEFELRIAKARAKEALGQTITGAINK